jgi:hypothetical protein
MPLSYGGRTTDQRTDTPDDQRSLRYIKTLPVLDLLELEKGALALAGDFARTFPGFPDPPAFPYLDGPVRIVPSRWQNVVAI